MGRLHTDALQGPPELVSPFIAGLTFNSDHTMLSRPLCVWRASFSPSDHPCHPLTHLLNRVFEILMAMDGLRARNIIQLAGVTGASPPPQGAITD